MSEPVNIDHLVAEILSALAESPDGKITIVLDPPLKIDGSQTVCSEGVG